MTKIANKCFLNIRRSSKTNKKAINSNAPVIDTMMEMLQTNESTKPTHFYETIDKNAQKEDLDEKEETDKTNQSYLHF